MLRPLLLLTVLSLTHPAPGVADEALAAFEDYTDFATYDSGVIRPDQLTPEIIGAITFIDTRRAEDFAAKSIPKAIHIEWRDVFARIDEIPTDRKVVLFCNTGVLSAQAAFGLRVLGHENVLVLQSGFDGWQKHVQSILAN